MRLVWSLGLEGLQREGKEGKQPLLLSFSVFWLLFFLFFSSLFSPSCGNEVACPPSSLACHPDTPPSLAHAQASYQLVSSIAVAGVDGTAGTTQSLLSSLCSLLTDNRCRGFSGNMRLLCWPLAASKNPLPSLQTCCIPELLANWKEISCRGGPRHSQTSSFAHSPAPGRAPSSLLFTLTQKQINYTRWSV